MNEVCNKFDTIRLNKSRSIFRDFFQNFQFLEFKFKIFWTHQLVTGRYHDRSRPVRPVTAVTGPVTTGKVNPGWEGRRGQTWVALFRPRVLFNITIYMHKNNCENLEMPKWYAIWNGWSTCEHTHSPLWTHVRKPYPMSTSEGLSTRQFWRFLKLLLAPHC
jgi:hypothetical protein